MIIRFITATGTGIGKTLVTAALCHQLRAQGKAVRVLKPIVTGLAGTPFDESDPGILLRSMAKAVDKESLDSISPFRFAAPLAPSMAAAREGRRLDLNAVLDFCRKAAEGPEEVLLIEGVGGLMVPLSEGLTGLNWIKALGCPAILVAGSYLGSLSHSLTALSVLRQAHLALSGLVVSETEGSTVVLEETAAALGSWSEGVPVMALPRIAGPDPWQRAPDLTRLVS